MSSFTTNAALPEPSLDNINTCSKLLFDQLRSYQQTHPKRQNCHFDLLCNFNLRTQGVFYSLSYSFRWRGSKETERHSNNQLKVFSASSITLSVRLFRATVASRDYFFPDLFPVFFQFFASNLLFCND